MADIVATLEQGLSRLERSVRDLRNAVDVAARGRSISQCPRSTEQSLGPLGARHDLDNLLSLVWNLEADEVGPLVSHLRHLSKPDALSGRLGLLVRLLLPEILPTAVNAIGDDLPAAVSAMAACDVVTLAEACDLAEVLAGWNITWAPPVAEVLDKLTETIGSRSLRQVIDPRSAEIGNTLPHGDREFRFTDIENLSDGDMITLLQMVDKVHLGISMRSAPAEVKERVFRVMTDRAADILRADMETRDDVGVDAVSDARRTIREVVLELAARGDILLPVGTVPLTPSGGRR
ncbi:MAG: FliG C-terminal domain-containing protein [Rhodospirillaceae bacterium]